MALSNSRIHAVVTLPATASPSPSCLQWSTHGQLILAAKNTIYILTPETGLAIHSGIAKKFVDGSRPNDELDFFSNVIEMERSVVHHWPKHNITWAAASVGALDVSIRTVASSSTSPLSAGKAALAVLNTNHELRLYLPGKDHIKGVWSMVHDITSSLREWFAVGDGTSLESISQAQTASIAWSSQPSFDILPRPAFDGSLFAIGSRSGHITFVRLTESPDRKSTIERVLTFEVSCYSVVHMTWSSWNTDGTGTCSSWISCVDSSGAIRAIRITQQLVTRVAAQMYQPISEAQVQVHADVPRDILPGDGDQEVCGQRIVNVLNGARILLVCYPDRVHLFALDRQILRWSGTQTVTFEKEESELDASAFYPLSGIELVEPDTILIMGFNGSIYFIGGLTERPHLLTSAELASLSVVAQNFGSTCSNAESGQRKIQGAFRPHDVTRILGISTYDHSGTFVWLQENQSPRDFRFVQDAQRISRLVVAELWQTAHDSPLQWLAAAYDDGRGSQKMPLAELLPIFHHLREHSAAANAAARVLDVLNAPLSVELPNIIVPQTIDTNDVSRMRYRRSLGSHLFGWPVLSILRKRAGVAAFMESKLIGDSAYEPAFRAVRIQLERALTHQVLHILVNHLLSVANFMSAEDMPSVTRIATQGIFSGGPQALVDGAQQLLSTTKSKESYIDPTFEEKCPACHAEVGFHDSFKAICDNGHAWSRCSITSFLLATPLVRTCCGCGRKALLPPSALSADERLQMSTVKGWIMEEYLEAASCCLFCENAFVTLV